MSLVLWTTAALVVWLTLWAIGVKAFDAFMLATVIILVGATLEILKRYLPGRRT
jgi:hypothetical protein